MLGPGEAGRAENGGGAGPRRRYRSGLLDGREEPAAATDPAEGPELGDLGRPGLDNAAAIALLSHVADGVAHRDGGVVAVALAPGLGEVALQKLDVRDTVDDAARRVAGKL